MFLLICLPIEDESDGCYHYHADAENYHNDVLRGQAWKHTHTHKDTIPIVLQ